MNIDMQEDSSRSVSVPLKPSGRSIGIDWEEADATFSVKPNPFSILGCGNRLQLHSPIIVRTDGIERANVQTKLDQATWNRIGSALRKLGGALLGPLDVFQEMPLRDVPNRICPISSRTLPPIDEVVSSDMIEIQLYSSEAIRDGDDKSTEGIPGNYLVESASVGHRRESLDRIQVEWPIDIPNANLFIKKVDLFRQTCEMRAPVGVAFCVLSTQQAWFDNLLHEIASGIDFVTLRMPEVCVPVGDSCLNYLPRDVIQAVVSFREYLVGRGMGDLPMIVDARWEDGYQAAQAIMAGATAVVVDSYLISQKPAVSTQNQYATSYDSMGLGGLMPASEYSNIMSRGNANAAMDAWDIDQILTRFVNQIYSARMFCRK